MDRRWLTRSEVACLIWTCRTTRELQDGRATDKRPLAHLVRFLILGIYTGSRPGAVLNASWFEGPGLSFVDLEHGFFHRHAQGERETSKRQPTARLAPFLARMLRKWARDDAKKNPRPIYVVTYAGQKVASVKTGLTTACRLAGLDAGVTAYTMRHTLASWLVSKGLSTRKVAEYLGTSEQIVRDNYGHLSPDYQDEAAGMIGRK